MIKYAFPALVLFASPAFSDISDEASACIDELHSRIGNVGGEVLEQMGSEAGTLVRLRDANGTEYKCIVWSGPVVAELLRTDAEGPDADDGGGAMDGAKTSAPTVSGTQQVQFAPGTSGMAMTATLEANTSVLYVLGASEGQFLNVDIGSHGGALDYKITNPDGSLLLGLVASDTPYKGQLWQSGDHVIEVLNAGAQPVSFDIGIGIN